MLEKTRTIDVPVEPIREEGAMSSLLALDSMRPSTTEVQADRRQRFDAGALKDLTESIRQVGVIQPIVVRVVEGYPAPYEIVAGERRWLAARGAGLGAVPAIVRHLTDSQVLLLQLVENVQREEVHPMTEAAGFERLMKDHGYTAEMIAARVSGEGRGHVYRRLKLLCLCPKAREAFSAGKLTLPTAMRLARVPSDAAQIQALKEITRPQHGGDPMSDREAARHLEDKYMLALAEASFPTADPDLLKAAGPCGTCPKRTGNQPELFNDVRGKDVCTDPACFQLKRAAWTTRQLEAAKASGQTIIDGAAAKKIAPWGAHHLQGYVRPTDRCDDDRKNRTFHQLVGTKVPSALLVVPDSGEVIEVIERKALAPILKDRGVGTTGARAGDSDKARRARAKKESAFRARLFEAIRAKYPPKLAREDLEQIALTAFGLHCFETRKRLLKVWQWSPKDKPDAGGLHHDSEARSHLPKLTDRDLVRFLLDCVLVIDLTVSTWSDGKPQLLLAAARRLEIDAESIRREDPGLLDAKPGRVPGTPSTQRLTAKKSKK